jgi:Mrp family chromosome partitioning ATPase
MEPKKIASNLAASLIERIRKQYRSILALGEEMLMRSCKLSGSQPPMPGQLSSKWLIETAV